MQPGPMKRQATVSSLYATEHIINSPVAADADDVVSRIRRGFVDRVSTNTSLRAEQGWGDVPVSRVLDKLHADLDAGLTEEDAAERLVSEGRNELKQGKRKTLLRMIMEQMSNLLMIILTFAAIISFSFQQYAEGIVIVVIVVANVSVSVYQERNADDAIAALKSLSAPNANVLRNRRWTSVPAVEIVPGDIVKVSSGDVIPADIRLCRSVDMTVEEKALTGESTDVKKQGDMAFVGLDSDEKEQAQVPQRSDAHDSPNLLFATTSVTAGWGVGVVVATGMQTRIGKIARLLETKNPDEARRVQVPGKERVVIDKADEAEEHAVPSRSVRMLVHTQGTPMQRALHRLAIILGTLAIGTALVVFVIGMATDYSDPAHNDDPVILRVLLLSIALAVSGVPEGLPVIVTLTLSLGMTEMASRGCLVRTLPAVETLGSANVICTDKTGTLTTGQMTARALWSDRVLHTVEPNLVLPEVRLASPPGVTALVLLLCNNAVLQQAPDGTMKTVGSSTERPLIYLGQQLGLAKADMDRNYPKRKEIAYSSKRKMMCTVHETTEAKENLFASVGVESTYVSCVKGAPTFVLDRCTRILQQGQIMPLGEAERRTIVEKIEELSAQAYRVLAGACKPADEAEVKDEDESDKLEQDLIFCGLVACQDPERPEVKEAIAVARQAGVRTVMITGDHLTTAVAIARNIELLKDEGATDPAVAHLHRKAVDCSVLRRADAMGRPLLDENGDYVYHNPKVIDDITRHAVVFARAQPQDKYEIVLSLQERQGFVCAMTGDGVNDAPALKAADIGVAMGKSGTETAKQASDVVLTDDNFASIVLAMEDGRRIYGNIQKFVIFLISVNTSELIFIFLCVCMLLPSPFEPLQILLLNLLTDGLPAMALCKEEPDADNMRKPPRPKFSSIVPKSLLPIIIVGIVGFVANALTVYLIGLHRHAEDMWNPTHKLSVEKARTMTFIALALSEYGRAYSVKSSETIFRRNIFNNTLMQKCVAFSAAAISIIIFTPGLRQLFGFVYLDGADYGIAIACSFIPLLFAESYKLWARRKLPKAAETRAVIELRSFEKLEDAAKLDPANNV